MANRIRWQAGVMAAFLLLAACYVGYQALHILFPQNVYETAACGHVSDTVEADGVLLFDEGICGRQRHAWISRGRRRARLGRDGCGGDLQRCFAGVRCASSSPS